MSIRSFTSFQEFEEAAKGIGVDVDLNALLRLDITFIEPYPNYVVINLRDYGNIPNNMLVLTPKASLLYSDKQFTDRDYSIYKQALRRKYGEATVLSFLALSEVLKSYSAKFSEIDKQIDRFGVNSSLEKIEETARELRMFADRMEDFVNLLISLEDRKVDFIHTKVLAYDFDVLLAKSRHLLDRSRNHLWELRDIREEMDVKITRKLNKNIEKLTVIMAFLTVVSVAISIPNTVGTFYGIPTLAGMIGTTFMLTTLAASLIVALVWGKYYWDKVLKE
jgi:Mg2+ and Co2+ transporter CorA